MKGKTLVRSLVDMAKSQERYMFTKSLSSRTDYFIYVCMYVCITWFYGIGLQHAYSPESDSESKHKKHKRDSRKNGGHEELEDGEVGEDGEIQ